MKIDHRLLLLGAATATALVVTLPFFASQVLSAEGAAGIYSVTGLLLIAALDRAPHAY